MAQIEWNQEAIEDFDEIYLNLMRLDVVYAENFAPIGEKILTS